MTSDDSRLPDPLRRIPERILRLAPAGVACAALVALTPVLGSFAPAEGPSGSVDHESVDSLLVHSESEAERLEREMDWMETWWRDRVEPVERELRRFHPDRDLVRRISVALAREGERIDVDPRLLASVLLVENPWLDLDVESPMGAVGLMQVMPFHAGDWGCGSADLTDLDVNICHGARIFARYLEETGGDVDQALLRYNGCIRGTNTPDCHLYPRHVYARAGRTAVLGWLDRLSAEDVIPQEAVP